MSFPLETELSEGCFFSLLFHAGQHTEYEDGWAASYNTTHPEATKSTDVRKRNYRVSAVTKCVNSFGEQKGKKRRFFLYSVGFFGLWGFGVCFNHSQRSRGITSASSYIGHVLYIS